MDENLNNANTSFKHLLDTWDNTFTTGKVKVVGSFNMCSEGGSFLFKEFFIKKIPSILSFFKTCVTLNKHKRCTNF